IGYYNAGTVEFIFKDGKFYFLEVNTRLQVEHPVTEMITDLDLVELQYKMAFGERVPQNVQFNGYSIECRITAEDPLNNFAPNTGKILVFEYPQNIRIDTFIEEGTEITPYYDSLLCKVITKGKNRTEAINNMIYALKNLTILPIKTNKNLLLDIIQSKPFQEGEIHTEFIQEFLPSWQEKYHPILDEKIISTLFEKYKNTQYSGVKIKQTQISRDLSMWKV
ncbi:MAG: acetyl-CoA carboxylase biotin carboxylase subunit, partial [bacterium]